MIEIDGYVLNCFLEIEGIGKCVSGSKKDLSNNIIGAFVFIFG